MATTWVEEIERLWELMTPEQQRRCVLLLAQAADSMPEGTFARPVINVEFVKSGHQRDTDNSRALGSTS